MKPPIRKEVAVANDIFDMIEPLTEGQRKAAFAIVQVLSAFNPSQVAEPVMVAMRPGPDFGPMEPATPDVAGQ